MSDREWPIFAPNARFLRELFFARFLDIFRCKKGVRDCIDSSYFFSLKLTPSFDWVPHLRRWLSCVIFECEIDVDVRAFESKAVFARTEQIQLGRLVEILAKDFLQPSHSGVFMRRDGEGNTPVLFKIN